MSKVNFVNGETELNADNLNNMQEVIDNLTSTTASDIPLSAKQGSVLAETVKTGTTNSTVTFSLSGTTLNITTTSR